MAISKEEKLSQISEQKKALEDTFNASKATMEKAKENYSVLLGEEKAVSQTPDGTTFETEAPAE